MRPVKIAVIGVGVIGQLHLKSIASLETMECVAVCDSDADLGGQISGEYGCRCFQDYRQLLRERICDAILIATPHYQHPQIAIDSLDAGYHVLVEKPIAVHKLEAERLLASHKSDQQVFATMYQMRIDPYYCKIKEIMDIGQLGRLLRVNWIITDWFRSNRYYASGKWRSKWATEGGGVLLNQSIHQLDLLQWLCGMPERVRGFCGLGQRHPVEVEDEVTAYFEFSHKATGVFITSTGEAPGTNRLEICGDHGKLVLEDKTLSFTRNKVPVSEFIQNSSSPTAKPKTSQETITISDGIALYKAIFENFSDAIINGAELIAPAEEGIHAVELANAILYSSMVGQVVELPLDGRVYAKKLDGLIQNSNQKTYGSQVRRPIKVS